MNDQKMNADELKKLKLKKEALYMRIRAWKRKGRDASELENEYIELTKLYNEARGHKDEPIKPIIIKQKNSDQPEPTPVTSDKISYYYRLNVEWEGISDNAVETVKRFAAGMNLTELNCTDNTLSYEFKGNDDEFKMLKRVLGVMLDVSFGSDFKIVVYGNKRMKTI